MFFLTNFDIQITNFIYTLIPHNHFLDSFFSFFSLIGAGKIIWIFVLALLLVLEEFPNRKVIVFFVIVFTIVSFTTPVIKNLVKRPRPCQKTNFNQFQPISTNFNCPSDYSFPSGHATTSFALASLFSFFDKKRKYIYYLVAGLIGLSRIYLGVHYFFDVTFGAILGYAISFGLLNLFKPKSAS